MGEIGYAWRGEASQRAGRGLGRWQVRVVMVDDVLIALGLIAGAPIPMPIRKGPRVITRRRVHSVDGRRRGRMVMPLTAIGRRKRRLSVWEVLRLVADITKRRARVAVCVSHGTVSCVRKVLGALLDRRDVHRIRQGIAGGRGAGERVLRLRRLVGVDTR